MLPGCCDCEREPRGQKETVACLYLLLSLLAWLDGEVRETKLFVVRRYGVAVVDGAGPGEQEVSVGSPLGRGAFRRLGRVGLTLPG